MSAIPYKIFPIETYTIIMYARIRAREDRNERSLYLVNVKISHC
jgi:hypothetical protein